jgi:hypothetical protein
MWVQAFSLILVPLLGGFGWWLLASLLLGLGTAMVYPALIAAIGGLTFVSGLVVALMMPRR